MEFDQVYIACIEVYITSQLSIELTQIFIPTILSNSQIRFIISGTTFIVNLQFYTVSNKLYVTE